MSRPLSLLVVIDCSVAFLCNEQCVYCCIYIFVLNHVSQKRNQTYQSRIVTLPQRLHATHKRIVNMESQLRQDLERPPTESELAQALGMTEAQVERCVKAMSQRFLSLDQQINYRKSDAESADTLYSVIQNTMDDGGYDKTKYALLREELVKTLYRHLDSSSADMVMLRFGLVDAIHLPIGFEGPLTIAQVSQLVGKKPDKVRRTILKSLKELRNHVDYDWQDFESLLD